MTETQVASAPTTPASAKKSKADAKPRKPKAAASHPKVAEMVISALEDLGEKGGSSLQAIKRYIAKNYKVDIERQSIFVRRYLKSAVAGGSLVQTKGRGASGSFKINVPQSKAPKTARQQAVAAKPKPTIMARKTPKKLSAKKVSKTLKKPVPKKLAPKPAAKKVKPAAKAKKSKKVAKKVKK